MTHLIIDGGAMLKFRTECRICGSTRLETFADLGKTPLADNFQEDTRPVDKFPLIVKVCTRCWLIQMVSIVDAQSVFHDKYSFFTSGSPAAVKHFYEYAQEMIEYFNLTNNDLVVEIASNDGTFLKGLQSFGHSNVLGIEPTASTANYANTDGVKTIKEFWNSQTATSVLDQYGAASLIVANNVVAHVDNLHDFIDGVKQSLTPNGSFVFEVHHALNLVTNVQFDNIYHEHLSYFSVTALVRLFEIHGMTIYDIQQNGNHGGSIRVFVSNDPTRKQKPIVEEILTEEMVAGLRSLETYLVFQSRVNLIKYRLNKLLKSINDDGKIIAAYGASAKSTTLLNFCEIGKYINYVADRTPNKFGKFTPGTCIPIFDEAQVEKPDYYLLTVWNYISWILTKEAEFIEAGGHFVVPLPEPKII